MPSLTKDSRDRSPYWICCYTASDGKQLKRSTKREDRAQAETICRAWQEVEDLARGGNITERQVREVMQRTLERATGKRLYDPTVRKYLEDWLASVKGTVQDRTFGKCERCVRGFLKGLGRRADIRLDAITTEDIVRFRDVLAAEGRTAKTANQLALNVLGRPFRAAKDRGLIPVNPVDSVKALRGEANIKGVFSPEQIRRLLSVATGDWKGFILLGYFSGMRLMDAATLRWSNVDLSGRYILFRQGKTNRAVQIPLHGDLEEFFISVAGQDKPDAPIFPELASKPQGGSRGLSTEFKRIMVRAGIDEGRRERARGGKGHAVSALSFHSLRHSFNSALANLGVSQELRMKMTGHSDVSMNRLYTHTELQTLRDAIELVPRLRK
jgi:integrase